LAFDLAARVCRVDPIPLASTLIPAGAAIGDAPVAMPHDIRRGEFVSASAGGPALRTRPCDGTSDA